MNFYPLQQSPWGSPYGFASARGLGGFGFSNGFMGLSSGLAGMLMGFTANGMYGGWGNNNSWGGHNGWGNNSWGHGWNHHGGAHHHHHPAGHHHCHQPPAASTQPSTPPPCSMPSVSTPPPATTPPVATTPPQTPQPVVPPNGTWSDEKGGYVVGPSGQIGLTGLLVQGSAKKNEIQYKIGDGAWSTIKSTDTNNTFGIGNKQNVSAAPGSLVQFRLVNELGQTRPVTSASVGNSSASVTTFADGSGAKLQFEDGMGNRDFEDYTLFVSNR